MDAYPYAFLDHLGTASQVSLSAGDAVSRLETALPVPLFNSTYRLRCVSDGALSSLIEVAGPGRGPWWLGPSTTPAGAGAVLEEYGLRQVEEQLLMSAALDGLSPPDPAVTVARARTPAGRRAWAAVYAAGRALPPEAEEAWAQVIDAVDGSDGPLRHYVASVDGVPAACASVLRAEGVAGLYCVAAPPAWKGLEQAVARYALADARAAGYATAVAEVEPAAVDLYRALGFGTRDVMRLYA